MTLQPTLLYGGAGSNVGSPITVSYIFTVLPTASFTATPPSCLASGTCPAVPCVTTGSCAGDNYEDLIRSQGVLSCTGGPATTMSRYGMEYRYAHGDFDNTSYNANTASGLAFAYNYDGQRTFWEMSDYAAAHSWAVPAGASLQPNGLAYPDAASYYRHCALETDQAYNNWFAGVGAAGANWPGGALREWNIFPNGPAMTYWRTGDPVAKQVAINLGSQGGTGGAHQGNVQYQYYFLTSYDSGREDAYVLDGLVTAWEVNGTIAAADQAQLNHLIDALLGGLDENINYDPSGVGYPGITHPQTFPYGVSWRDYMLGTTLEALIEAWEQQGRASVTQDPRIPLMVQQTLDWMWTNIWSANAGCSTYNAFYYNGVDLPHDCTNNNDNFPELNNLVCGAFAWYWKVSGNSRYQTEGDTCWQNAIGAVAVSHVWFTGKDVNQIFKWSSDYMGYRSINNYVTSTAPSQNPLVVGGVPDTVPPVPRPILMTNTGTTNSVADLYTAVQPVTNITGSSVTISWSTYKGPLTTVAVDYGPTASYGSSATGTSTNCASISACSTGCNATVGTPQIAMCKQSYWNTVVLTGLTEGTTYHFRTRGVDANGNQAVSNTSPGTTGINADFTFVTASSGNSVPLSESVGVSDTVSPSSQHIHFLLSESLLAGDMIAVYGHCVGVSCGDSAGSSEFLAVGDLVAAAHGSQRSSAEALATGDSAAGSKQIWQPVTIINNAVINNALLH